MLSGGGLTRGSGFGVTTGFGPATETNFAPKNYETIKIHDTEPAQLTPKTPEYVPVYSVQEKQARPLHDTLEKKSIASQTQTGIQPRDRSPEKQTVSASGQIWLKAMNYAKHNDYEQAFRLVLKDLDDIYLLRLVA